MWKMKGEKQAKDVSNWISREEKEKKMEVVWVRVV